MTKIIKINKLKIVENLEIIKKSKFYAYGFALQSETDFFDELTKLKYQHKKATHFCYAYRLKQSGVEIEKFSDDAEPSGTAGRPILNVIKLKQVYNYAVIVVRYFGGVKLGAGGLVRAYIKSASKVIDDNK